MKNNSNQTLKELFKFCLVGISNVAVDNVLYWVFTALFGMDFRLSKIISYLFGMINSWFWNSRWTFKSENKQSNNSKNTRKKLTFILVNLIAMGVQILALAVFEKIFAISNVFISLFVATPASLIVNFIGNKILVFK